MLIRLREDGAGRFKEFYGTPVEIVDQMRDTDLFRSYENRREYVTRSVTRLFEQTGRTIDTRELDASDDDEELCMRFLAALVQGSESDLATLVVNDRTWDADTAKTLRTAVGLSQARFARLVPIDPQTVSRWERGINRPSSSAIVNAVADAARGHAVALDTV